MLTLESHVTVRGVTGQEITDFLLEPHDDSYRAWWPGTHLEFHVLRHGTQGEHVGDVVWMDEYVGGRRVRMAAEVVTAVPGEKVVWRLRRWGLRLPVRLTLDVKTEADGVALRHTLTAGWPGRGRVFDPLWKLYFSRSWAEAMDQHAHTEFPLLGDLLRRARREPASRSDSWGTARHPRAE